MLLHCVRLAAEYPCSNVPIIYTSMLMLRLRQAFVEEEQEWQEGVDNSRYRRSTRLTASVKPQRLQEQAFSLTDALQSYCQCMQHMLLVRCPALLSPSACYRLQGVI